MDNLFAAAEQFQAGGKVMDVREFGNGNINDTFLVTVDTGKDVNGRGRFVLQRINTQVFRQPEHIMQNMRVVTEHMCKSLAHYPLEADRRWEVPRVLMTRDGQDHWRGPEGEFWRAISFIDRSRSYDVIKDIRHAEEVGRGLGIFHALISDLHPDRLFDTLEGFHITPLYLRHYSEVMEKYTGSMSPEVNYCIQFISGRSAWAHVLEDAREQGRLGLRPIHGDPKVNNFMIDDSTGQAVSIVDLDTVKPGLVHYDIGDCLRSGCNPLGEETESWETVSFAPDICRAVLKGYLPAAGAFLTRNDYDYLYDAVRLIAFELGLRFFTDYLEGNIYFRAGHRSHNLFRALVQFRLTESIESREKTIRSIIRDMQ